MFWGHQTHYPMFQHSFLTLRYVSTFFSNVCKTRGDHVYHHPAIICTHTQKKHNLFTSSETFQLF